MVCADQRVFLVNRVFEDSKDFQVNIKYINYKYLDKYVLKIVFPHLI